MPEVREPDYSIALTKEKKLIQLWQSIGADPTTYREDAQLLSTDDFKSRYASYAEYQSDVASRAGAWRPELGISALNTSEIDFFLGNLSYSFDRYPKGERVSQVKDPVFDDSDHLIRLYELKKVLFSQGKQTCGDILTATHKEISGELDDGSHKGCFLEYNNPSEAATKYGISEDDFDQYILIRKLITEIEVAQKRDYKRQLEFDEFWRARAKRVYNYYRNRAHIRYTDKGEKIEPITWKTILARVDKIEASIGNSGLFDFDLPLVCISGNTPSEGKPFEMDETGDGYLVFPNYTIADYTAQIKDHELAAPPKNMVRINKKDGTFSVDKTRGKGFHDVPREVKIEHAVKFFCAYVRFLHKNLDVLAADTSTPAPDCALGLFKQDPVKLREMNYREDQEISKLLADFRAKATCLREMPDEALLLDTARIFLALMLEELCCEQLERLDKKERSLRVTPVVFTLVFFAALVGVFAVFRYTLIDRMIGQLAMTALFGLILIFDIIVACVVRRNRQFKRPYGLKKGEVLSSGCVNEKKGRGRRWALSFLIVSLLLLITGCYFMGRYDAYDETYYYNRRADNTVVVAGLFDTKATDLTIPSEYKGATVIGVAQNSFLLPNSVKTVKASSSCTQIGTYAFRGCGELEVLDLSAAPVTLGAHAFESCDSLVSVSLHTDTTVIPESCFRNCVNLTEVKNALGVISVEDKAFLGCAAFDATEYLPSVRTVGKKAFSKTATDSVDLSGFFEVGAYAFAGCDAITELKDDDLSPELILGEGAFSSCSQLCAVDLAFSGTALPKYLFKGCENLQNAHIRGSVSNIEKGVLYGCSVDSVTLPYLGKAADDPVDMGYFISSEGKKTLRYVKILDAADEVVVVKNGFKDCSALISLECNKITRVEKAGFKNCSSFENIVFDGIAVIEQEAFANTALQTYTSGADVQEIGDKAFAKCRYLTSVTIMDPSLKLGKNIFDGCSALTEFTCASIGTDDKPRTLESVMGSSAKNVEKVHVTEQTVLADSAFENCKSLTSVDFAFAVEVIPKKCFKGSKNLNSVVIPGVKVVKEQAFEGCVSIAALPFDGVETIEEKAFKGTSIAVLESATIATIEEDAFAKTPLVSVSLSNSSLKLDKKAFNDCSSLTDFTCSAIGTYAKPRTLQYVLGNSASHVERVRVTEQNTISDSTFENCKSLTSVDFASSVEVIPKKCFKGSENLNSVVIPGVKVVKEQAFEGCVSIAALPFDGVEKIEEKAFKGTSIAVLESATIATIEEGAFAKTPLTAVSLTNPEISLGENAFDGCDNLVTVSLGRLAHKKKATSMKYAFGSGRKSVTVVTIYQQNEFAEEAFMGCESLQVITMAQPVSVIAEDAFRECYVLMELNIAGVQEVGEYAFYRCYAIDEIPFETQLIVIEEGAFAESGVVRFRGGAGLEEIGKKAFRKTEDLALLDLSACTDLDIKKNAFDACDRLTDVRLYALGPNGKERTMKDMFGSTRHVITDLQISGTVSGKKSFSDCRSLVTVTMSDMQTDIPEQCFKGCKDLTFIAAPSVTTVKEEAFSGCVSITSVFPTAQVIEDEAYKNTSVSKLDSALITKIGEKAFEDTPMQIISLPNAELDIGEKAFDGCTSLYALSLGRLWHKHDPVSMEYAFGSARKGLPTITLYAQTELAEEAFCGCSVLETVNLDAPLATISEKAFYECYFFAHLNVTGVQNIEDYAFYRCYAIDRVPCEVELAHIGKRAFSESGVTSFRGGESLMEIGNSAFRKSEDLASLDVSACWALDIEKNAFADCDKLTDVKLYALGPNGKEHTMKYMFADSRRIIVSLQIASPIHSEEAFADCESLVSMILSDLQVEIPDGAFSGCHSLLTVYGRNVERIGDEAFKDCTHFYAYSFSTLTEVGAYAFANSALSSFDGKDTVKRIGKSAFKNTSITSVQVTAPDAEIGKNAFAGCDWLTDVTVNAIGTEKSPKPLSYLMGDSLAHVTTLHVTNQSSIAKGAFIGAESLSQLTYDLMATEIPKNAFKNCPSLEHFEMAYVKKIGESAFENCRALRMVNLSSELTEIGKKAFKNCVSLESISIPDGVEHIEKKTFSGCSGLKEVTFGKGLKTIEKRAFEECSSLTTLTLNEGFEKIRKLAFLDCNNLTCIYLPSSLKRIACLAFFDYDRSFYVMYGGSQDDWDDVHKGMAFLGTDEYLWYNASPSGDWQAHFGPIMYQDQHEEEETSELLSAARMYGSNAVLPDYYADETEYDYYPSNFYSSIDGNYYSGFVIEFDGFFYDRTYYLEHFASILYENGFSHVIILNEGNMYWGWEMIKGDTVIRFEETSDMYRGDGYHVWLRYTVYTINNPQWYN